MDDSSLDKPVDPVHKKWTEQLRSMLLAPRPKASLTIDDLGLPSKTGTPLEGEPIVLPKSRDDSVLGTGKEDALSKELWRKKGSKNRELEEALDGLRNRYTLDRTAVIDQLTGKAFSTVRQEQLGEIPESGHLAQGYGLKAATKKPSENRTEGGIRVQDKLSTGYMRDELPAATTSPFRLLYKAEKGKDPGPDVHFLNSTLAYKKMKALAPVDLVLPDISELLPLPSDKPVCWALEFPDAKGEFKELMHSSGATPSTHTALKSLAGTTGGLPPALGLGDGTKAEPGKDTFKTGPGKKLAELPDKHPAKATATSVKNLMAGLKISKLSSEDPLVKNALANLDKLVNGMASCAGDATRFSQLYDLFVEEMFLVLARAKPYKAEDFKTATVDALKTRAPALKTLDPGVTIQPFLVASGMDALSTALIGAREHHGGGKVERDESDKSYFETAGLLDHAQGVKGKGPVLLAALNGSTPVPDAKGLNDVGGVIDLVKKKLIEVKPELVTLILDITIEQGGDEGKTDLALIFEEKSIKEALDAGELTVVLCKSYQKYSTMGSGKIMAGNLTLVGKPEASAKIAELLTNAEKEKDPYDSDEAQLMTHMLKEGASDETAMLKRAASNAKLVHEQCWPKNKPDLGFEEGLPFMMAPQQVSVGGKEVNTMDLCAKMGMDWRESFSFQQASCLATYTQVRINTGQESDAGCMEKLYAVGLATQGPVDPLTLRRSVDKDLAELGKGKTGDPFAASKAASQLLMTAKVLQPTDPSEGRALQVQIQALLDLDSANASAPGEGPAKLTPEMRSQMARECLRLTMAQKPPDFAQQKTGVGEGLRHSFEAGGSKGGWDRSGGGKILLAMGDFTSAKTLPNAQSLADECTTWLAEHLPGDSARAQIEALRKDAQFEINRLKSGDPLKPLVKALPYAEDVARFLMADAPDSMFGTVDATSKEGGELLDACLSRLDLNSRVALFAKLDPKTALGAALKQRLEALLIHEEPNKLLSPETLADTDLGHDGPARSLSPQDLEQARKLYVAAQYKTWSELEGWMKNPTFSPAWLKPLQELRDGIPALATIIAAIGDEPVREQRMNTEEAKAAKWLTASMAKLYIETLGGKVLADLQNQEIQRQKELRVEQERIKQEQLDLKINDVDKLAVAQIIDRMPDIAGHADKLKELDQALKEAAKDFGKVQLPAWLKLQNDWEAVFKHVQNAPRETQDKEALQKVLEKKLSEAYRLCTDALVHLVPKDPEWLDKLRESVSKLSMVLKAQVTKMLEMLESPQARDVEAGKIREFLRKQSKVDGKNLAERAECWP
jgi:hypothetical protein